MNKFLLFVLIFSLLIGLNSCLTFRIKNKRTQRKLGDMSKNVTVEYFDFNGVSTRYLHYKNANDSLPLLVLIHGAPGSSSAFIDYLKSPLLIENYSVIVVDRLGYGYSDYGNYASILKQSQFIISLIESFNTVNQKVFIAGHSYGGTITASIAALQPQFLTASVMMAPAIDPENEKYFWFGKLGKWKATRWMATKALKVATDEKYNHAKELQEWSSKWTCIKTPILHMHGDKDKVVPFVNLAYAQATFPKEYLSTYVWERTNHFFPFSSKEKTIQLLHEYFQKNQIVRK